MVQLRPNFDCQSNSFTLSFMGYLNYNLCLEDDGCLYPDGALFISFIQKCWLVLNKYSKENKLFNEYRVQEPSINQWTSAKESKL